MCKNLFGMAKRGKDEDRWEGPWQGSTPSLDRTDVATWFSLHPFDCLGDPRSAGAIRSHEEPERPWYGPDRWQESVQRQHIPWWDDLREQVKSKGVPDDLAYRFADYLAGYALVREFDQPKADSKQPGRVSTDWRKAKRLMRANRFPMGPALQLSRKAAP